MQEKCKTKSKCHSLNNLNGIPKRKSASPALSVFQCKLHAFAISICTLKLPSQLLVTDLLSLSALLSFRIAYLQACKRRRHFKRSINLLHESLSACIALTHTYRYVHIYNLLQRSFFVFFLFFLLSFIAEFFVCVLKDFNYKRIWNFAYNRLTVYNCFCAHAAFDWRLLHATLKVLLMAIHFGGHKKFMAQSNNSIHNIFVLTMRIRERCGKSNV